MEAWSPEQWTVFLGGVGILIGAVATAAVKIIHALKGIRAEISEQTSQITRNTNRLQDSIERTGTGNGGTR